MSARPHDTAAAVVQRLLVVLPLAHGDEGAGIDELARDLGVEPRRILRDLEEVRGRSYYLPAGLGEQLQLTVTRERLTVWTTGEFRRPVRLGPREAVALELALRVAAGRGAGEDRSSLTSLARRLTDELGSPAGREASDLPIVLGDLEDGSDAIRGRVDGAVREGKVLRIRYRAPGRDPSSRRVGPLVMAHAEGRWYLLARDLDVQGLRAFRLDRILSAEETPERFRRNESDTAEVERFFQDGRIHDGGAESPESFDAVVDYSSRIARWIRERGWERIEELEDGGVRVRHRVVDPEWLLRHVLSYGTDAWLVEPDWMKRRVVEAAERLGAS